MKTNVKKNLIKGWVWVGLSGVVLPSLRETRAKCVLWAGRTYPGRPGEHGKPVRAEVRVGVGGGRGKRGRGRGVRGKRGVRGG